MASFKTVIQEARIQLEEANLVAEMAMLYMVELCQMDRAQLYVQYEEEMPKALQEAYTAGIERLLKDEPLDYVLGFAWFYGYRFSVNDNVLIPRPETEELVANILIEMDEHLSDLDEIKAVDIGTGSGAIAISVALEESKVKMIATDISSGAIEVAKQNANDLNANVSFLVGDMLQPLIEQGVKLDFLISNPPYIPQEEELENSVKNYEPHVALFGGEDGLKFYRQVLEGAKQVLKPKAIMAFEIGYNQKEALLQEVARLIPQSQGEVLKDINGKDRMLIVRIGCE